MADRLALQTLLESITERVYFKPPSNLKMEYPCIMYQRDGSDAKFADNRPYSHTKRYQVTVVDRNPDSELPDKVEALSLCTFDRHFLADNLHHFVFTLFF
jgi:hypothetical protein